MLRAIVPSSAPITQQALQPFPPLATLTLALNGARIPGLDFLRMVAVLLVLADHSGAALWGTNIGANGALGVELFFVISGFLITWMLLNEHQQSGRIDFRAFYQRRIVRLMPVFYAYVAACILMLWVRSRPVPWDAVIAGMAYVLNYQQALTGAPTHFLSHCWSLAVEEQFYFIWPLVLVWLLRKSHKLERALVLLIAAVWAHRFHLQLSGLASDAYIYRALDTRADHLLVGCLAAVLLQRENVRTHLSRISQHMPWLAWLLAIALVVSGQFHGNRDYRYLVAYSLEPIAMAVLIPLVILAAQRQTGWIAKFINCTPVVSMGQASYGIYLFHPLLLHPVRNVVERLTGSFALAFMVSVGTLGIVAWLSFKHFENPLRRAWRPRPR
jgi:peptidoglycan/LPS O-acetylase OafA/YrhL